MLGRRRFSMLSFKELCNTFSYTFVTKSSRSNSNNFEIRDSLPVRQLDSEAESLWPYSEEESS